MTTQLTYPALLWLLNWLLHSSLLLSAAWLFETLKPNSAPRLREWLWRVALVFSLVSASAATLGLSVYSVTTGVELPLAAVAEQANNPLPSPPVLTIQGPFNAPQVHPGQTVTSPITDDRADRREQPSRAWANGAWLISVWVLVSGLLLLRLVLALRRAIGQLGERVEVAPVHRARVLLKHLAHQAGISSPRLTVCRTGAGPVSLIGHEICLSSWALNDLDDEQLTAVLAHELAHCRRLDPWCLLLAEALRRVLFMQPLLHLAARRLANIAELIADEKAVELTDNRRALASSMTECAGRRQHLEPVWGIGMARNRSAFLLRVQRLLNPQHFAAGAPNRGLLLLTLAGATAIAVSAPGFTTAADVNSHKQHGRSVHVVTDDDGALSVIKVSVQQDNYQLKIKGNGAFTLNDDETDIAQMDVGTKLTISEQRGRIARKIQFESNRGNVERTFWRDGQASALDDQARNWLGEILPRLMRETGIDAERRAARLHARGGADRLIEEIGLIDGDYVIRLYAVWLAENDSRLSPRQLDGLLDAAANIASDYENRQTLSSILTHQQMDDRQATRVLEIAADIESDHELRVLVEQLVEASDVAHIASDRLIELIQSIESDYEMRSAFEATLRQGKVPASGLPALVSVAGNNIDSDFELRTLLESVAAQLGSSDDLALAYVSATISIGSDHERREALSAFATHASRETAGWPEAIRAAADIESDHECAEALLDLARRMPATEANSRLVREGIQSLTGYQRERAESALASML